MFDITKARTETRPSLTQVYTNVRVVYRLQRRPASKHTSVNAKRQRTNHLISFVTIVFLVSYTPITCFRLAGELRLLPAHFLFSRRATLVYAVLMLLCSANAILNPVLYDYVRALSTR